MPSRKTFRPATPCHPSEELVPQRFDAPSCCFLFVILSASEESMIPANPEHRFLASLRMTRTLPMQNLMAEGMRWFGPPDTVSLAEIRQTGATQIFSSLHEIPYGEVWPADLIASRQREIAAAGLVWRVVESVPVPESIKTRTDGFERCIENYRLTLERLGAAGIEVVVYNFMPV